MPKNNEIREGKKQSIALTTSNGTTTEQTEIWKDITGYEGLYQVSNMGRVRSLDKWYKALYLKHAPVICRKGVLLKPNVIKDGYFAVSLHKDKKCKTMPIHILVARTFITNKFNKPCIDHINGNKTDNRSVNLRWVTNKENQNNPITRRRLSISKSGKNHPFFGKHFSEEHARKIGLSNTNGKCSIPIVQLDENYNFIKEYPSTNEAQRQTGISHGRIWHAIRKNGIAGGYRWAYKKDFNKSFEE